MYVNNRDRALCQILPKVKQERINEHGWISVPLVKEEALSDCDILTPHTDEKCIVKEEMDIGPKVMQPQGFGSSSHIAQDGALHEILPKVKQERINEHDWISVPLVKEEVLSDCDILTQHADEECIVKEEMDIGPTVMQSQGVGSSSHTTQSQRLVEERPTPAAVTAEVHADSHTRVELPVIASTDIVVQEPCVSAVKEEGHSDSDTPLQLLHEDSMVKEEMDIGPTVLLSQASPQTNREPAAVEGLDTPGIFAQRSSDGCCNQKHTEPNLGQPKTRTGAMELHADIEKKGCEGKSLKMLVSNHRVEELCEDNTCRAQDESSLKEYELAGDKDKPYVCTDCGRRFTQEHNLTSHMFSHSSDKPHTCEICQRKFSLLRFLNRHRSLHRAEGSYICHICQRAFSQKRYLVNHLFVHSRENPYTCDICNRRFSHKSSLFSHLFVHKGEKPYTCDICQRCFYFKRQLIKHMSVHSCRKPYTCDICQRSFSQKYYLISHHVTHRDEKPYKCDICPSRYNHKSSLTRHLLAHGTKKQFICNICDREYTHKSSLTSHLLIHKGERPYTCDICQHSFVIKQHLAKHMSVHSGKKPYKCDICQRTYSQKYRFTIHRLKHSNDKPYTCDTNLTSQLLMHKGRKP